MFAGCCQCLSILVVWMQFKVQWVRIHTLLGVSMLPNIAVDLRVTIAI